MGKEQPFERGITCSAGSIDHEAITSISGGSSPFHTVLLHHGMVVAGLPYSFEGNGKLDEVSGCSPYGASTIVKPKSNNTPSQNELFGARYQGRYIAELAVKLSK
ncbi:hypothetical protein [Anaerobranca californiensis]|nr:hypothetical protein [Anaerobranca californiensis]